MKSKKRSLIQDLPTGLSLWWLGLCTVSVLNIGLLARLWMKHLKNLTSRIGKPMRCSIVNYPYPLPLFWLPFDRSCRERMFNASPWWMAGSRAFWSDVLWRRLPNYVLLRNGPTCLRLLRVLPKRTGL